MKLINMALYFFVFLFIFGCSETSKDFKLKEDRYYESVITYEYDKEKFYLIDDISLNKVKRVNLATSDLLADKEYNDTISIKQFKSKGLGKIFQFTNYIEIKKFENNYVYLVKKRDYFGDNVFYHWEMKCEIVKGSAAAYNNGDTIEVKEVEIEEHDKANAVLYKVKQVNSWKKSTEIGFYYDPTQASVKFTTRTHTFWISKKGITENLITNTSANVVLVKAVE